MSLGTRRADSRTASNDSNFTPNGKQVHAIAGGRGTAPERFRGDEHQVRTAEHLLLAVDDAARFGELDTKSSMQ